MHLLKFGNQVTKTVVLNLAQQSMGNVGRHVAMAHALPNLGSEPLGDSGRQLLSTWRLTHRVIIPMVGSMLRRSRTK